MGGEWQWGQVTGGRGCYPAPGARARLIDFPAAYAQDRRMRIESSVTSITWIPSEAVRGVLNMPFDMSVTHYAPAPPDVLADLAALRQPAPFPFPHRRTA